MRRRLAGGRSVEEVEGKGGLRRSLTQIRAERLLRRERAGWVAERMQRRECGCVAAWTD